MEEKTARGGDRAAKIRKIAKKQKNS